MANGIAGVDHVELIKDSTAIQYSESTVLEYSQALNVGNNELDQVFVDLACRLDFANQTGVNLDVIGRIVGQPRTVIAADGNRRLTNEEYIKFIEAKIFKNHMQSTPEQNIQAYTALIGLPVVVEDANPGGGRACIIFQGELTPDQEALLQNKETLPKTIGVEYCFASLPSGGNPEQQFFGFLGFPNAGPMGDDSTPTLEGGTFPNTL